MEVSMACLPEEVTDSEICRKRGDTFPIEIQVTNKTTGANLDITGNTFTLSVSTEEEPPTASYVFQSTGTILVALDGTVTFPISDTDADNLGEFFFDIEMVAGTIKTTVMGGTYVVTQDITK